jgi:peptidoglycan/xylan/chitin deacetylase (PgdA/CDA1 family)
LTEFQPQKFNRALISINFDDGWRSAYQNALPILNKYSLATTQYIQTNMLGDSEHMTTAMVQAFKNQGSEITSHSVTHPQMTTLSTANLNNELLNSQSTLRQTFGSVGVANNFASPFGEYNTTVISAVKQYYRSHRSIDGGYNTKDNFNAYNIRGYCMTSTTTTSDVQTMINEAIANNAWLVLVYHEVGTTYGGTTYTNSTSDFDAQMNYIKQSGITVETIDQALDEVTAQL